MKRRGKGERPARDAVAWYDDHAETVTALYEKADCDAKHAWLAELLPPLPARVLDVGAGSGRDAAWFAAKGYDVLAVEPSTAMRLIARRLRPDAAIRWLDDRLPGLETVRGSSMRFDLVLLSAVWMHIAERDRTQAFRRLAALLEPGGILAMSFREGPANRAADIHRVSLEEVETFVGVRGAMPELRVAASRRLPLNGFHWNQVAIRANAGEPVAGAKSRARSIRGAANAMRAARPDGGGQVSSRHQG